MTLENKTQTKKAFSFDWLVGGVLSKLGDTFDRLTGRNWNPSSGLATSKLIEKLKFLLDSEVRDLGKEGKFVPHEIKLKMQWDKFSSDSEQSLTALQNELHAAAIDHINDKLYHTFAPMNIQIKTDYFTEGVKMLASFGKFADKEDDEVSVNVTVPNMRVEDLITDGKITVNLTEKEIPQAEDIFIVRFSSNLKDFEKEINFSQKKRISVGRTKENDLAINDQSVSKIHAALILGSEKQLLVADTGSTNGTFINGQRIAYGKAIAFEDDATIKFGTVETSFERVNPIEIFEEEEAEELIAEQEFMEEEAEMLPTEAAININQGDLNQEIQPTQANFEEQIPQPTVAENVNEQVQPTQASVEIEEKVEEKFSSPPEFETNVETNNESQEININETQDWEI